jgi:DNA-binding transcriptional LysR family regulator
VSIELKHLQSFVAVAEELNFTRAAERLHLAQQALSRQIGVLEDRLGTKLFIRTTRKVELTPAGEELLVHARGLLSGAESAVEAARAAAGGEGGSLTVGFFAAPTHDANKHIIEAFAAASPSVDVRVRFGDFKDPTAGLKDGQADVAFVSPPFSADGLMLEPIYFEPRVGVVSRRNPLAELDEIPVEKLLAEKWLDAAGTDPVWRDFWVLNDLRGGEQPVFGAEFHAFDGLLEAVRADLGVAVMPRSYADALGPAGLGVAFRPVPGIAPTTTAIGWRADDTRKFVQTFVETAMVAYEQIQERAIF